MPKPILNKIRDGATPKDTISAKESIFLPKPNGSSRLSFLETHPSTESKTTAISIQTDALDALDEVDQIHDPHTQVTEMLQMLDTLSAVFAILTLIALALAFVICYNMGLMNFVERIREYATLKVLGYHQKEIRSLILRENTIISVLGVLAGIGPGYLLTDIVMHACEPETGFYPGVPTVKSVFIACIVTYFFSQLIQRLLTRKVRSIDMVEALKSVE